MPRKMLLYNLFATIFVFAVIFLISQIPNVFKAFDPIDKVFDDLDINDLYFSQVRNSPLADTNIIICNVGADRADIARQIRILSNAKPAVVGIDIRFLGDKDPLTDAELSEALKGLQNKVIPIVFYNDSQPDVISPNTVVYSNNQFSSDKDSFGFINLQGYGDFRTIRYFHPKTTFNDSTYYAFAVQVANFVDRGKVKEFLSRNNEMEAINYRGNSFREIDTSELFNPNFDIELLKDKIVLLGFLGNDLNDTMNCDDKFYTPLNPAYVGRSLPDMYGVSIHANIVSMILNGNFIDMLPVYASWLIAFVFCYLNITFFGFIEIKFPQFYGGEIKLFVILECVLIVFISFWILDIFSLRIDTVPILISLIFTPDVSEIFFSSGKKLFNYLKNKLL